jgi:hypothetical protein
MGPDGDEVASLRPLPHVDGESSADREARLLQHVESFVLAHHRVLRTDLEGKMNAATASFNAAMEHIEERREADAERAERIAQIERHHFDQRLDVIRDTLSALPGRVAAARPDEPAGKRTFLGLVEKSLPLQWGFGLLLGAFALAIIAASIGGDEAQDLVRDRIPAMPSRRIEPPPEPRAPEPTE